MISFAVSEAFDLNSLFFLFQIPFCLEILDKFITSDHAICSSVVMSAAKKSLGKDKNDLVRVICHVIGVKDVSVSF